MSTEALPRRIGKYELRQVLGKGGMGTVYRALEIGLHRSVAVKLMKSEYRDNDSIRQRFIQEARAVAALDHPNIVKIYYFDDEPELYLVMEFVPSGSLRGYLRHHQEDGTVLEVREALLLTRQIADALHHSHSHSQHMVHRDVKPDNVLLKPRTIRRQTTFHPLLTDFGLVKLAEDAGFQTQPGTAIGTYAYMSPEQLKGSNVDHRTDIYALGIMLYELVVGRLPFKPKTASQAYDMHHFQEPPAPRDIRDGISTALENLILKAIAKNPNDRFQTALDMSEALIDIESGEADQLTMMDTTASEGGQLESLSQYMTALPGTPVDDEISRLDTPQDLMRDRVAVQKAGEETTFFELTRPTFIIGRTDDADITLPSTQVSRQHARINRRRDGTYTITDLGSTNKTFIDGVELLSDISEPWGTSQMVAIGEYRLTLQHASAMQDTHPDFVPPSLEGILTPTGDTAPSRAEGSLHTHADQVATLQLSPSYITVQAGSQSVVNVMLQNTTNTVEHFQLQIQGIPNDWVSAPPTPLQLMPGASGSIPITFHPPMQSTTTAGDHPYNVRVTSQERGMEIARSSGTLSISAYHRFTLDLMPARITNGKIINLTVRNQGNSAESIMITPRDRAAAIRFEPSSATLNINPGQEEVVRFQANQAFPKWLGANEMLPFELRAVSRMGQEQTQSGELVVKPRLPIWMAGLLTMLCSGFLLVGAYIGFIRDDDPTPTDQPVGANASNTPSIQPSDTHTAEPSPTQGLAPAWLTATTEFEQTATTAAREEQGAESTSIAQTATAEYELIATAAATSQTTLDIAFLQPITSLDPTETILIYDNQVIENLFLGLFNFDPITGQISSELANSFVSSDGYVWIISLRDDVKWMRYDPSSTEAFEERPVTAEDVVFGIQRACDPRLENEDSGRIVSRFIAGCENIFGHDPSSLDDSDVYESGTIEVYAIDDFTLELHTTEPFDQTQGYLMGLLSMPYTRPLPKELVLTDSTWQIPGTIWTNGAFYVDTFTENNYRFVRSSALPADMDWGGNIQVVNAIVESDQYAQWERYAAHEIDMAWVPSEETQTIHNEFSGEFYSHNLQSITHLGFPTTPPFDDSRIRRAFGFIIDRQIIAENVLFGQAIPAKQLTPSLLLQHDDAFFYYDPEFARALYEEAGVPDCSDIQLLVTPNRAEVATVIQAYVIEVLGCELEVVVVEFPEFIDRVFTPIQAGESPTFMWLIGYDTDVPYTQEYFDQVCSSVGVYGSLHDCGVEDYLAKGDFLSAEATFAEQSPVVPIYEETIPLLIKPWVTGPFSSDGIHWMWHWGVYNVDMDHKLGQ